MATRLVFTADVHLDHGRWGKPNPATGRNTAWESAATCWEAVCTHTIDTQADGLVVAGDLFLNGHPSAEAQELAADGLRRVTKANIPVLIIGGNHELIGVRPGHRGPLERYADLPGVTVHTSTPVLHEIAGVRIVCVPWPRRGETIAETDAATLDPVTIDQLIASTVAQNIETVVERLNPADAPIIVAAHAAIGDAIIGSNRRGSEMLVHAVFAEPILPTEAVCPEGVLHTIAGHIHKRQHMGDRAHYVGSPDRIDFSEEHELKAFSVATITDNNCEIEQIETPARHLNTLTVTPETNLETVFETQNPNTIVRVSLSEPITGAERTLRAAAEQAGITLAKVEGRVTPRDDTQTVGVHVAEDVSLIDGLNLWFEHTQQSDPAREHLTQYARQLSEEIG